MEKRREDNIKRNNEFINTLGSIDFLQAAENEKNKNENENEQLR